MPRRAPLWRRRWPRLLAAAAAPFVFYALFLALGFVPRNRGYQTPTADAVVIFVRSNEVHTDVVLPVTSETGVDWRQLFPPQHFRRDVRAAKYVAVGWGNREFYVNTPTWAEFRVSTAVGALFWPSESVLHVEYLADAAEGQWFREVRLSREQYQQLAAFVRSSAGSVDERGCVKTASDRSYTSSDRFYCAAGRYHCFNTCNQWTGRGLAKAGVPVGIWTPLQPQVLYWLPQVRPDADQ